MGTERSTADAVRLGGEALMASVIRDDGTLLVRDDWLAGAPHHEAQIRVDARQARALFAYLALRAGSDTFAIRHTPEGEWELYREAELVHEHRQAEGDGPMLTRAFTSTFEPAPPGDHQ